MLSDEDVAGVKETLAALVEAWNRHDMDLFGEGLDESCVWVNTVGMHWRGKATVVKAHKAFHARMFRDVGQRSLDVEVGEVVPGVAVAVETSELDDYTTPDGRVMRGMQARLTFILVKRGERWLVRSAQGTTIDQHAAPHDPALRG